MGVCFSWTRGQIYIEKEKLGGFLLICSPIVNLILLIATVFDIKNGAVATAVHGLAAIYIGVSIAFGPQIIQWADGILVIDLEREKNRLK